MSKAIFTLLSVFLLSMSAWSMDFVPNCTANGQILLVNNSEVLNWKATTKNGYLNRGHITGKLTRNFADHSGHKHFEVKIGVNAADTIEVVYNESFGAIPTLTPGVDVESCGDYITSNAPNGHFPASPDGAILHWVHNETSGGHAPGYVAINGVVYGQGKGSGHGNVITDDTGSPTP